MATVRDDNRILDEAPLSVPASDRVAIEQIERLLARPEGVQQVRLVGLAGETIQLPPSLVRLLKELAHAVARDPSVALVPVPRELTTRQAAELLNVSRPFLVEHLLDTGVIPYTMTGAHRRIALADVLAYKRQRDRERRRQLDELAQMSQEMGLDRQ